MIKIVAAIILTLSLGILTSTAAGDPKLLTSAEFERMVRDFPKDIGFGYAGAAFFQKRLFVSCNLGLVLISDDGKMELLQWRSYDSVIEGPWLDRANGAIWAQQASDGSLVRFDGKRWDPVAMPNPPEGFLTRGDVLSGFRGVSGDEAFWMQCGNWVWRWDREKASWKPEPNPPMAEGSHIRAFLPYRQKLLYFVRLGYKRGLGGNRAVIYTSPGQWHELATADLHVKEYVITDASPYILTEEGAIFELSGDQPVEIKCPAPCEAIVRTSAGGLLASFAPHGVFIRVGGSWSLKVKTPYATGEGEHWAHLAEESGRIALATAPVPRLVGPLEKVEYSGSAGIWISEGGDFRRLQIGQ